MPVKKFTQVLLPSAPSSVGDIISWITNLMAELKGFLDNVVLAIGLFVDGDIEILRLTKQTVEPVEQDDGTIAYADGTIWNPGAGEGVYARYGGVWNKL